jgi:hypothetical protein
MRGGISRVTLTRFFVPLIPDTLYRRRTGRHVPQVDNGSGGGRAYRRHSLWVLCGKLSGPHARSVARAVQDHEGGFCSGPRAAGAGKRPENQSAITSSPKSLRAFASAPASIRPPISGARCAPAWRPRPPKAAPPNAPSWSKPGTGRSNRFGNTSAGSLFQGNAAACSGL